VTARADAEVRTLQGVRVLRSGFCVLRIPAPSDSGDIMNNDALSGRRGGIHAARQPTRGRFSTRPCKTRSRHLALPIYLWYLQCIYNDPIEP